MKTKAWFIPYLGTSVLLCSTCLVRAADPLDTWAQRYVGASVRDIAWGNGLFVAVGDAFYDSPDGVCWTRRALESPSINGLSGVAYGNGRFVAVESGTWRRESRVFTSSSGSTWQTSATMPASELPVIQRVYFAGGIFLAVGQEPNPSASPGYHWLVMTSLDGVNWDRHSGPTNTGESYYLNAAAFGNGTYVVGGWSKTPTQQGLILTSTDLATWSPVTGFPFSIVQSITYGAGNFVAVGSSIATSSDGIHWTNQSSGIAGGLSAVAFGANSFVTTSDSGLLLSSTIGVNWTQHVTEVDAFEGITFGNGSFVAVGGYYSNVPRGVAVQSGGRPQVCLQALGFGPPSNPGFRLLLTAERGRTYRLQSSPVLPPVSWTDVRTNVLPPGYPDPVSLTDTSAARTGQLFYQVVSP